MGTRKRLKTGATAGHERLWMLCLDCHLWVPTEYNSYPHVREQQSFNYYAGTVNRKEKYFIDLGTESAGLGFTGLAKIVEIEKRIVFKGANQSINQWNHFKTEPELPCQNCLSHLMPQTLGVLKHNHWTGPKATFCVPKNCVQR